MGKGWPVTFEGAELFLGGRFLFARRGELVLAEDAGDGVEGTGQGGVVLEAFGSEAGLLAQLEDVGLESGGGLGEGSGGGGGSVRSRRRVGRGGGDGAICGRCCGSR